MCLKWSPPILWKWFFVIFFAFAGTAQAKYLTRLRAGEADDMEEDEALMEQVKQAEEKATPFRYVARASLHYVRCFSRRKKRSAQAPCKNRTLPYPIYACIHACVRARIAQTSLRAHTHTHIRMHACMHACMVWIILRAHACIQILLCGLSHVYVCTEYDMHISRRSSIHVGEIAHVFVCLCVCVCVSVCVLVVAHSILYSLLPMCRTCTHAQVKGCRLSVCLFLHVCWMRIPTASACMHPSFCAYV